MTRSLLSAPLLVLCTSCAGGLGLETLTYEADTGLENLSGDDDDDEPVDESDSGPSTPTEESPEIESMLLRETSSSVEVILTLSDPDGDLIGGMITLSTGDGTSTYGIPEELYAWTDDGLATIRLEREDCDGGTTVEVSAWATDVEGHDSAAVSDALTLAGSGHQVKETGDTNTSDQNIGAITPPVEICGHVYQASHDQTYTGDLDWIRFQAAESGSWLFSLSWASMTSDYDLYLLDSSGQNQIASSWAKGSTQPESFAASVTAGESYLLVVAAWSGESGDYLVAIP